MLNARAILLQRLGRTREVNEPGNERPRPVSCPSPRSFPPLPDSPLLLPVFVVFSCSGLGVARCSLEADLFPSQVLDLFVNQVGNAALAEEYCDFIFDYYAALRRGAALSSPCSPARSGDMTLCPPDELREGGSRGAAGGGDEEHQSSGSDRAQQPDIYLHLLQVCRSPPRPLQAPPRPRRLPCPQNHCCLSPRPPARLALPLPLPLELRHRFPFLPAFNFAVCFLAPLSLLHFPHLPRRSPSGSASFFHPSISATPPPAFQAACCSPHLLGLLNTFPLMSLSHLPSAASLRVPVSV